MNADALVRRYLALHRVGLLSLYSWPGIRRLMMGAILMVGLINGLYQYQTTMQAASLITDIGVSLILSLGLWMTGQLLSVQRLKVITENAICDYLENYLKSKLVGSMAMAGR